MLDEIGELKDELEFAYEEANNLRDKIKILENKIIFDEDNSIKDLRAFKLQAQRQGIWTTELEEFI
ncbi:hypothetical protein D3C71_2115830 [compost metagenome]